MILFKQAKALSNYLQQQKSNGVSIGFVPTMGALHKGHLSLLDRCKKENGLTVCSIFVNPTQFDNPDDFKKYPVTIEKDIEELIRKDCDVLFLPPKEEIYPIGYQAKVYELGQLETVLEGKYRPGHFQGVCQVVDRLLEIVHPDQIYLGQKDYQQCKVIQRLIDLTGRKNPSLIVSPTVRERDGLAMSSRNLRLNEEQRAKAPALFENLNFVKTHLTSYPISELKKRATEALLQKGFKVDYFEIVDAQTLLPAKDITEPLIAVVAAYLDDIRLIDNLPLS